MAGLDMKAGATASGRALVRVRIGEDGMWPVYDIAAHLPADSPAGVMVPLDLVERHRRAVEAYDAVQCELARYFREQESGRE